jgi:hypothetical protein
MQGVFAAHSASTEDANVVIAKELYDGAESYHKLKSVAKTRTQTAPVTIDYGTQQR